MSLPLFAPDAVQGVIPLSNFYAPLEKLAESGLSCDTSPCSEVRLPSASLNKAKKPRTSPTTPAFGGKRQRCYSPPGTLYRPSVEGYSPESAASLTEPPVQLSTSPHLLVATDDVMHIGSTSPLRTGETEVAQN